MNIYLDIQMVQTLMITHP